MRVVLAAVWVLVVTFWLPALSVTAFSLSPLDYLSPFAKSAVCLEASLGEALASDLSIHRAAVVVLARGSAKPARRAHGQALAAFSPRAAAVIPLSIRQALASTLLQLEALRGRPLFPLTVDTLDKPTGPQALPGAAPWGVLDLTSGQLLLQPRLLELLASPPAEVLALLSSTCISSLNSMTQLLQQALPSSLQVLLSTVLVQAVAAGVAAAFAVPRWFCFVCPIVLGLLAPLVINTGVGAAAAEACSILQLSDDECVDLWLAALAVGMILSLLSAMPIFKVCRLYECAHPANSTAPAVIVTR